MLRDCTVFRVLTASTLLIVLNGFVRHPESLGKFRSSGMVFKYPMPSRCCVPRGYATASVAIDSIALTKEPYISAALPGVSWCGSQQSPSSGTALNSLHIPCACLLMTLCLLLLRRWSFQRMDMSCMAGIVAHRLLSHRFRLRGAALLHSAQYMACPNACCRCILRRCAAALVMVASTALAKECYLRSCLTFRGLTFGKKSFVATRHCSLVPLPFSPPGDYPILST
jgi:hypothetical protein